MTPIQLMRIQLLWDYICDEPEQQFADEFEFHTSEYGPGHLMSIICDGKIDENDWWQMFFSNKEAAEKHAATKKVSAMSAAEEDKWMNDVDLFAAAKLFRINIVMCRQEGFNRYIWQYFAPSMNRSLLNEEQDRGSNS
ncbi:hypothetical protein niasHS_006243 [Heterodera schachtii]|uniref:Uncharacterized protein n=1 Tax=Heterodera schachtii TaxID=97005 RepID=A0ABD2JST8_HETSC